MPWIHAEIPRVRPVENLPDNPVHTDVVLVDAVDGGRPHPCFLRISLLYPQELQRVINNLWVSGPAHLTGHGKGRYLNLVPNDDSNPS